MTAALLEGRRVLVVEDDYLIAEDLRRGLRKAGAIVVGPVAALEAALALVKANPALDAAVLDVNLNGNAVYPIADALAMRGVPFVFATGYNAGDLASAYQHLPRCEKPVDAAALAETLAGSLN